MPSGRVNEDVTSRNGRVASITTGASGAAAGRGCGAVNSTIDDWLTGAIMAIKQGATHAWTKSSYSTGNGACVEVKSPTSHAIAVRDSKEPAKRALAFAPGSWTAFVSEVRRGVFDLG
jgi:hypothetical protein